MRTIYSIELENDKFFLFLRATESSNPIELFLEAVLQYEYVRQNKPVAIKEIWAEAHILDLDQHVKQYMILYGIDRVRGGSYSNPLLTNDQRAFLHTELQGPAPPLPLEVIKDTLDKYASVVWSNEDGCKERTRLLSERGRFQRECAVLANLRRLDIPKVRADLDWIRHYCEFAAQSDPKSGIWSVLLHQEMNGSERSLCAFSMRKGIKPGVARYRQILLTLRDIYSFMALLGKPFCENTDSMVPLQYPQFLLDNFFYGSPIPSKTEHVRQLCEAYKTFVTTWENRLAEAEFDVASWGPYADERFSYALTILDLLYTPVKV